MLYRFGRWLLFPLAKIIFSLRITGRENLPQKGGFILCSNHRSVCDPCFLAAASWPLFSQKDERKSPVRFMGKSELFTEHGKSVAWLLRKLGAFPVERDSADLGAIRRACQILQNGEVLGIFPQGRCVPEGVPFRPKSGAALIAVHAAVPVVPVCICIHGKVHAFSKAEVRIGKPIMLYKEEGLSEKMQIRQLTRRIAEEINILLEEKT